MAKMDYVTPGITKIEFEDSLFVTTELNKDENLEVNGYIESRGGIIKNSVTKTTDYLIYKDGEEETTKYKKALELIRDKGLEINILSLSMFYTLLYIMSKRKEVIEFGSYPYEKDGTRRPIQWMVLKEENNRAMLLSVYGICLKRYNQKWIDVTWETCTLRKWLNKDFFNDAFTEEEKKRVCMTTVENADNPRYGTEGGNDTEDRMFLLSIGEAETMLPKAKQRIQNGTPYAEEKNWWWLRSPGNGSNSAAAVYSDGDIGCAGICVDHVGVVCPALWIDLESEIE